MRQQHGQTPFIRLSVIMLCFITNNGLLVHYFILIIWQDLDIVVEQLKKIAHVVRLEDRSAISLVGNAEMSPFILGKTFSALRRIDVKFEMISEVSFEETHVSLVVPDSVAEDCEQALRSEFFANDFVSKVQGAGNERPIAAASTSGVKRKAAGDDHPDQAPQGLHQEMAVITDPSTSAVGSAAFPGNDPIMGGGITNNLAGYGPDDGADLGRFFDSPKHMIVWDDIFGGHNPNYEIMFDNFDVVPGVDGYADYPVTSGAGDDGWNPVCGSALEVTECGHQARVRALEPSRVCGPTERLDKLLKAIRSLAGCWPTSRKWNGQGLRVCLLYVQNQSYQLFGHSQKLGMHMPTCPVSSSFCLATLAKSWASKTLAKVLASQTLGFGSNQAYPREGGSE